MIFPRWAQWRKLPTVLGKTEKIILSALGACIVLSLGYLGFVFYMSHTELVPASRGEYREGAIGDLKSVNPLLLSDSQADRDIASLIFSGLFKHDTTGALVEDLAERYDIANRGATYLVYLRNDVLWHDKERFTANDVVYTFQKLLDPDYKSNLRTLFKGVIAERIDDYTVRFTLDEPNYLFLENLTIGIVPKHIFENIDPKLIHLEDVNLKAIGTGPYQFSKLVTGDNGQILSYVLSANKYYYGKTPYLKTVVFKFYASEDAIRAAFANGEIDGISSVHAEEAETLRDAGARIYEMKVPRYFALFLNQSKNKALADGAVRSAMDMALNREAIIASVLHGEGEPMYSLLPLFLGGRTSDSAETTQGDVEKAKKILADDGWKETDGVLSKTLPKKEILRLEMELVTSDSGELQALAEAVKEQLHAIGMNVTIKSVPVADLAQNYIKTRKYDSLLFGEVLGLEPDFSIFWHSSFKKYPGLNLSLYENKNTDKILESLKGIASGDDRASAYQKLEQLIDGDHPALFLYTPYYLFAVSNRVKGVETGIANVPSERFNTISDWYTDLRRAWK